MFANGIAGPNATRIAKGATNAGIERERPVKIRGRKRGHKQNEDNEVKKKTEKEAKYVETRMQLVETN